MTHSPPNKHLLLQHVLNHLQSDLQQAHEAALSAHESATHEENVAENKYDTLGLEAAYLASGQAKRVEHLRQVLITWRQLTLRPFDETHGIELGTLVQLAPEDAPSQWLLLGPPGASLKLLLEGVTVQVIGHAAPLGSALIGKAPGDELNLSLAGRTRRYEILQAY